MAHPARLISRGGPFAGALGPTPVCAAIGVAAGAVAFSALPFDPELAIGVGVRVALGTWCCALLFGALARSAVWLDDPVVRLAGHYSWRRVVVVALVLIAVALQRAPGRLAANLVGYALLIVPVVWFAKRTAGARAAACAAAAVGVFVLLPAHVDRRTVIGPNNGDDTSPYIWSVGWPSPDWALRHQIVVPVHFAGHPMMLTAPLANRYVGPGRVRISANGIDLGEARTVAAGEVLQIAIPDGLAAKGEGLSIELRLTPYDRHLRLLAHRWVAGASGGSHASAFFDTREWLPGTFADLGAGAREGVLLLSVDRSS